MSLNLVQRGNWIDGFNALYVNVIIWPSLLEKQRREALGSSLLAVYGVWQREGEVRHLVAHRLVDVSPLLGSLVTSTRNFH